MTKDELIDKMNSIIEAINEHILTCPECHLKSILRSLIGDSIELD
jgi:hypothetical protein